MSESFGEIYEILGVFSLQMRPSPSKRNVLPRTAADAAVAGEDNTGVMHGRIN